MAKIVLAGFAAIATVLGWLGVYHNAWFLLAYLAGGIVYSLVFYAAANEMFPPAPAFGHFLIAVTWYWHAVCAAFSCWSKKYRYMSFSELRDEI